MKEQEVLFSEKFQKVYNGLRVFSFMSVINHYDGVDRSEFVRESGLDPEEADRFFSFLCQHHIADPSGDKVCLDSVRFFSLTLWDLLVLAEPWLANGTDLRKGSHPDSLLPLLGEKLSTCYICDYTNGYTKIT